MKNKNHYGTFVTKRPWYFCRKCAIGSSLILFAVVSAGFVGYKAFKNKPVEQVLQISSATASEMPGWWYDEHFGSSVCEAEDCKSDADPDEDKLTNAQEFYYHSSPVNRDTNSNGLTDGEDVALNFDPSKPGKMTFDEVTAPENLLGESLVLGKDIRQMVADSNDVSKVNLPLVENDQLQIIYAEDATIYKTYASKLQSTMNKYFPQRDISYIRLILKSGNDEEVFDIKLKSAVLSVELKKIQVPVKLLMFHKYNISMFQLLSEIIPVPLDLSGPESEVWYDKVQAFLVVQQKLNFEELSLKSASLTP